MDALSLSNGIKIEDESLEIKDEITEIEDEIMEIDISPSGTKNKTVELNISALSKLPKSTKAQYLTAYNKFMEWRCTNSIKTFSEDDFLAYFRKLSETYKPPTLNVNYSILKTSLTTTDEFDLRKYAKLNAFVREKSAGFKSVSYKSFKLDEVKKFINEAPDDMYLVTKVVLIFGIIGTCSVKELLNVRVNNVNEYGSSVIVVKLPDKFMPRSFTITDQYYKVVKKYMNLRPSETGISRFFLTYRNGKCIVQPMGINKFRAMAKSIAHFLKLPDPERYCGYRLNYTTKSLFTNDGPVKRKRIQRSNSFDDDDNVDPIECNDDSDDNGEDDDDYQIEYDDNSDYEVSRRTKKQNDEQVAQSSSLNQEDDTNLSIQSENMSFDDDHLNNDLDPLSNERIAENNSSNRFENLLSNEKVYEKSNETNSDHIVEDPASSVRKTANEKETVCEQVSQNENTTDNEQNIDSPSKIDIPHEKFNLAINNCHNFTLNFYMK